MDDHDDYLEYLVRAADRIAEAARTEDIQVLFREIDRALNVPVPGDIYHPWTALLTALGAQVNVTTLQADRIAWAKRVRPLEPFLRGPLPQIASGLAATVHHADPDAIEHAFRSSMAAASAAGWPDPIVALAVALAIQVNTKVDMEIRNAWTLALPTADGRRLEVAA